MVMDPHTWMKVRRAATEAGEDYGILQPDRPEVADDFADRFRDVLDRKEIAGVKLRSLSPPDCENFWGEPPEHPVSQRSKGWPEQNRSTWVRADVCISPVDYMRLQMAAHVWQWENAEDQPEAFFDNVVDAFEHGDDRVWSMRGSIHSDSPGGNIPMPHTTLNAQFMPDGQEGRHRAIAAYLADKDEMRARISADWEAHYPDRERNVRVPSVEEVERYLEDVVRPAAKAGD